MQLTGSLKVSFAGARAGMRLSLNPPTGDEYCYTLTAADANAGTVTIPVTNFKQMCWDTTNAVPYSGTSVRAIQLAVLGSMTAPVSFDFCVIDVEPG